jgi:6-phosphogluconate dehydrogenase
MGGNVALHALELGMRVVGADRRPPAPPLVAAGLEPAASPAALPGMLAARPRRILLYVPVGPAVDALLDALVPGLAPGDVVADCGNSYWRDSRGRARRLASRGVHLVDVGTSGGVEGARGGACFMVGGAPEPVGALAPVLQALAAPGGYVNAGPSGAGHFAKLVHNGIEFGMLQAIGEGVDLLERHGGGLAVGPILEAWRHGSVVRSWLVDLLAREYAARGGLADVPGTVEDTGEVSWLVADALRMEVPIPVIAQAVMQLFASRDDERRWARAIAVMRHGFGGHAVGRHADVARLRRVTRLSDAALEDEEPGAA